jgi:hypothetical protein
MAMNCRDGRYFLTACVRCSADVHSVNVYAFIIVDIPHTRISVAVNFEIVIESRGRLPTPKLAVTVMSHRAERSEYVGFINKLYRGQGKNFHGWWG